MHKEIDEFSIAPELIILFQHLILGKGYEFGSLCQLGVFFHGTLGDKKTRGGPQVIDSSDDTKEYTEDGENQQGAVEGPSQKNQNDHYKVNGYQGQRDRPMGKSPVQQQMVDMISIRAERTAAVQDTDTEYPQGIQ